MDLSIKAVDLILHTFSRQDIGVPMSHAEEVPNIRAWALEILAPHIQPPADAPAPVTPTKRRK